MNFQEVRAAMQDMGRMIPQYGLVAQNKDPAGLAETYGHLRWMVEESLTWPEEKVGKLNRWLGFVQGVLFAMDEATIDELREVNLAAKEQG